MGNCFLLEGSSVFVLIVCSKLLAQPRSFLFLLKTSWCSAIRSLYSCFSYCGTLLLACDRKVSFSVPDRGFGSGRSFEVLHLRVRGDHAN